MLHATATPERNAKRPASRRSSPPSTEAKARLTASREETAATLEEAERSFAALPSTDETETRLAAVRSEIETRRHALAELRAEAQGRSAREAELAARRLSQIAAERADWSGRIEAAGSQVATIEARTEEARTERASRSDARRPSSAEKRRALITEIENAEAKRRGAADRLSEAESAQSEADRDARAALESTSAAREEAARAEERFAGANRRLADVEHEIREMLEVEPEAVAELAEQFGETRRSKRPALTDYRSEARAAARALRG